MTLWTPLCLLISQEYSKDFLYFIRNRFLQWWHKKWTFSNLLKSHTINCINGIRAGFHVPAVREKENRFCKCWQSFGSDLFMFCGEVHCMRIYCQLCWLEWLFHLPLLNVAWVDLLHFTSWNFSKRKIYLKNMKAFIKVWVIRICHHESM